MTLKNLGNVVVLLIGLPTPDAMAMKKSKQPSQDCQGISRKLKIIDEKWSVESALNDRLRRRAYSENFFTCAVCHAALDPIVQESNARLRTFLQESQRLEVQFQKECIKK